MRQAGLLKRIVIPNSMMMLLVFGLFSTWLTRMVAETLERGLEQRMNSFLGFVERASSPLVYSLDIQSLKFFVDEAKNDPDIVLMTFMDAKGKALLDEKTGVSAGLHEKMIEAPIVAPADPKELIGKVRLIYSHASTDRLIRTLAFMITGSLVVVMILQVLVIFFIARKIQGRISRSTDELEKTAEHLNGNSREMHASSTRLSELSNKQAAAIQETVATLNEISSMVRRTEQHAAHSSEKSNLSFRISVEARQSVEQMRLSLEGIQGEIGRFGLEVETCNRQLSLINGIIQDIEQKTEVINAIVFQTRLLSFNASVEAARAGEQGKGFTVVAEEVGNLARMSGQASQEIASKLAESRAEVEKIICFTKESMQHLIRNSNDKVQEGARIADGCSVVLLDAVKHAEEVKHNLGEVATATREQSEALQNITGAMNELDGTTQLQADIAQELLGVSSQLHADSGDIHGAVVRLEREIQGVKKKLRVNAEPSVEADEADDAEGSSDSYQKAG